MIFDFVRPNDVQRKDILWKTFEDTGINENELSRLVAATGPDKLREYGYTYSDIMQRLLPATLIEFFPDKEIDFNKLIDMAKKILPTPPFKQEI